MPQDKPLDYSSVTHSVVRACGHGARCPVKQFNDESMPSIQKPERLHVQVSTDGVCLMRKYCGIIPNIRRRLRENVCFNPFSKTSVSHLSAFPMRLPLCIFIRIRILFSFLNQARSDFVQRMDHCFGNKSGRIPALTTKSG